jgi:hypothetical protein
MLKALFLKKKINTVNTSVEDEALRQWIIKLDMIEMLDKESIKKAKHAMNDLSNGDTADKVDFKASIDVYTMDSLSLDELDEMVD